MNSIRNYLLSIFMLLGILPINAQPKLQFSIVSFQADKFDTSANIGDYVEVDGSGNKYAIIKVSSNNHEDNITEFNFNFGNMASHVKDHEGELWVYVQRNAKNVTISRPGYLPISKYNLGMTIEAGQVYKMVLTSDRVQQQVVYDVKMQMVIFQMTPAVSGLTIMIKRQDSDSQAEIFGVTDKNGAVAKSINFGKYAYSVLSPDKMYHVSEGLLAVNNSDETFVEKVSLKPNYADMTFIAEDDVEIFVNNESKGKGRWSERMVSGEYIITCKQANHRDSQQRITVKEGNSETINLLQPTPITGVLTVNTSPLGAAIKIDGKDYGVSPRMIKDLLIGSHNVEFYLPEYKLENRTVIIKENDMTSLDVAMAEINSTVTSPNNNVASVAAVSSQVAGNNVEYSTLSDGIELSLRDMLNHPMGDTSLPHISTYNYNSIYNYFKKTFGEHGFSKLSGSTKGCSTTGRDVMPQNFYYKGTKLYSFGADVWKDKSYAKIQMYYVFSIPAMRTYQGAKEFAKVIQDDLQSLGFNISKFSGEEEKEKYTMSFRKTEDSPFGFLSVYRSQEGWTVSVSIYYK